MIDDWVIFTDGVPTGTTYKEFFTTAPPLCDVNSPSKEHPEDCHKFFECSPSEGGLEFVEKTCGPTMFYNPQTRTCDWPEAVIAIKKSCEEKPATRTQVEETKGMCIF